MVIKKALILFAGLVAIILGLEIAELYLLHFFDISEAAYRHLFGIITWITPMIAYAVIFKLSGFKVNFEVMSEKFRSLKLEILIYLLVIAFGLELLDRPFFDFEKIWDYYFLNLAVPYRSLVPDRFIFYTGIYAIFMAPVLEEVFFRKFLFGKLSGRYSATISILVSSLCFALFHLPSLRNLIPTFIFGVIACLLYKRTGNILYTIILHALINFLWFTLQYWGGNFYTWIFELKYNFIYWFMFAFGIGLTYFSVNQIGKLKTSRSKE